MISDKVVYIVDGSALPVTCDLALQVQNGKDGTLGWVGYHNTVRSHMFYGELKKETDDGFVWTAFTPSGANLGEMNFRLLTLDEYVEKMVDRIVGPAPAFATTDELQQYYLKKFGNL